MPYIEHTADRILTRFGLDPIVKVDVDRRISTINTDINKMSEINNSIIEIKKVIKALDNEDEKELFGEVGSELHKDMLNEMSNIEQNQKTLYQILKESENKK
jgi:Zn-dependent oligopeptidase